MPNALEPGNYELVGKNPGGGFCEYFPPPFERLMNDIHFSSQSNEWETPSEFFDKLNAEFQFTLDAAASAENAKCADYFTAEDDGLKCIWGSLSKVWLNPPYGRGIGLWIAKAATEPTEVTVMLIPARTDTKAWHQHIFGKAEIRFIPGRLKFSGHKNSAPFPCAVVIFRNGFKPPVCERNLVQNVLFR